MATYSVNVDDEEKTEPASNRWSLTVHQHGPLEINPEALTPFKEYEFSWHGKPFSMMKNAEGSVILIQKPQANKCPSC